MEETCLCQSRTWQGVAEAVEVTSASVSLESSEFFLTWNPVGKKVIMWVKLILQRVREKYQVTGWEKIFESFSSRAMSILAHPRCFSSCFSNSSLWHLQFCCSVQQVGILFSNLPLTASRSLDHLLPSSAVPIPPGDPPILPGFPQMSLTGAQGSPSSLLPWKWLQNLSRQLFPFQPRFLELAACPHLDTLPDMRQRKPLELFPWHSELLFFNANCCLGICIWNGFAFP